MRRAAGVSSNPVDTRRPTVALTLEEIADRMEIEQLLVRYCHAIDSRDWDAYRSVYTPDAVIDDVGAAPGNSVEDMVAFLSRALDGVIQIQHAISTSLVEIDGDTASARTVCHCPVVLDRGTGETEMFFQGLWYVDELVRTPAGWRIAKRAERDYFHNMPPDFRFE
jgi:ketosteroid isomerase-like protein